MQNLEQEILQSRHQFIYGKKGPEREALIRDLLARYPLIPGENTPSLIQVNEIGLQRTTAIRDREKYILERFAESYLEHSIELSILKQFSRNHLKAEKLCVFLHRMNELQIRKKLSNLEDLIQALEETKEIYKSVYQEYLKTGEVADFLSSLPIDDLPMYTFIEAFDKMIENESFIGLIIDYQNSLPLESVHAINDYVSQRINKYVSMKIFCESEEWPTYYAFNGQTIERTHDYGDVTFDSSVYQRKL